MTGWRTGARWYLVVGQVGCVVMVARRCKVRQGQVRTRQVEHRLAKKVHGQLQRAEVDVRAARAKDQSAVDSGAIRAGTGR